MLGYKLFLVKTSDSRPVLHTTRRRVFKNTGLGKDYFFAENLYFANRLYSTKRIMMIERKFSYSKAISVSD